MHPATPCPSGTRLSICIATFNRAGALRATLERLCAQITDECEIIVADNASSDDTKQVALEFAARVPQLRYIRHESNKGWERNFHSAVCAASGEYCWLMPDDDVLKSTGVSAVLTAIRPDYSLIIVNVEYVSNWDHTKVVIPCAMAVDSDRVYRRDETDRLFREVSEHMRYVGAVVIKRSIWLERAKEQYFESWFVQVGVIFCAPLPGNTLVIREPQISVTLGGQRWLSESFDIFAYWWPLLVRTFPLSDETKWRGCPELRSPGFFAFNRACGQYSLLKYRRQIQPQLTRLRHRLLALSVALLPATVLNALYAFFYRMRGRPGDQFMLQLLDRKNSSPSIH